MSSREIFEVFSPFRRHRSGRVFDTSSAPIELFSLPSSSTSRNNTGSSSRTVILTEEDKKMNGHSQQYAGGSSTSVTHYNLRSQRSTKPIIQSSAEQTFRYIGAQQVGASGNAQAAISLGNDQKNSAASDGIYSIYDLKTIKGAISANLGTQFSCFHGEAEYVISNSGNSSSIIWIYDVVPRRDIGTSDTSITLPLSAWSNGYGAEGSFASMISGYNFPFATPFDSKLFCEAYKIIKVHKFILGPGVIHRHIVKSKQHRWISDDEWINTYSNPNYGSTELWMRKRTVLSLLVSLGQPVHSSAASTNVSVSDTNLDIVWKKIYRFKFSDVEQRGVGGTNALYTIVSANQRLMPEVYSGAAAGADAAVQVT
jgi:hypothetical protein